ncbi:MAG: SpaH/EbpB family LPXTG-anchored major pilin [Enterococcus sp.]
MKARGKLVSLLMALVCLLPIGMGLLGFGDSASAATPQDVKVTLHKKKMDDFPKGVPNDGEINPEFENKYEGLANVEFTPWDVTDTFYAMLKAAGVTGSETDAVYKEKVKEVMENAKDTDFDGQNSDGVDKKLPVANNGPKSTGPDGTVVFDDLPDRDTNGVYRVYWFEETLPQDATEFSQLVLLMLPVEKVDQSGPNDDIHLYPKNKLPNKPVKDLLKEDGTPDDTQGRVSFDIGKEIKYKVTYQIPVHIGEIYEKAGKKDQTRYSKLIFKDAVTHDGVRFKDIDSIKIGSTNVKDLLISPTSLYANFRYDNYDSGYLPTGQKAGFEIQMKLSDKTGTEAGDSIRTAEWLDNFAGQTIEIIYTVQFTENTPVDEEINNTFYVGLEQSGKDDYDEVKPEDTPPPIVTGGKKFLKHDNDDQTQALKGAEFVITNKNGTKYLKGNSNNYTWEDIVGDQYADAIKLTSGDLGYFEIKGLAYGEYKLVEIKAPDGYKTGGPIDFTVDFESYTVEETLRTKVPNISRGGFLPSTGGAGIIAFLVIGLSLMGIAIFRYRKTQHAA